MKKVFQTLIVAALYILMNGCSDFLEQSSQDLIIPNKVEHYKEVLQGDGYFKEILSYSSFINYMTDDMQVLDFLSQSDYKYTNGDLDRYSECYTWQREIENDAFTDNLYLYLYNQVLIANTCLDAIDNGNVSGSEDAISVLRGQACFQRALSYFYLANIYAQAYNESQPTDACVPLRLTPTPSTSGFSRASINDVWTTMRNDIDNAIKCLEGYTESSVYEINYKGALVLATRIALFMEDYDATIQYGEKLLSINNSLYNIVGKYSTSEGYSDNDVINFIDINTNPEIVFNFDVKSSTTIYSLIGSYGFRDSRFFMVSTPSPQEAPNNLISIYEPSDYRFQYWFVPPMVSKWMEDFYINEYAVSYDDYLYYVNYYLESGMIGLLYSYRPLKYDDADGSSYQFALRTGEVYISLAEAYARKESPNTTKALEYLNALRKTRIDNYNDLTSADFADNTKLVEFVWEERRRELCFEELHRWWDLRREGQPEIVHNWIDGKKYKLLAHDPAYVLNFPIAERDWDQNLVGNTRPERANY